MLCCIRSASEAERLRTRTLTATPGRASATRPERPAALLTRGRAGLKHQSPSGTTRAHTPSHEAGTPCTCVPVVAPPRADCSGSEVAHRERTGERRPAGPRPAAAAAARELRPVFRMKRACVDDLPALGAGAGRGPGTAVQHAGGQRLQRRLQRLPLRLRPRRGPLRTRARGLHGRAPGQAALRPPERANSSSPPCPAHQVRAHRMQAGCMAGQEADTPAAPHTARTLRGLRAGPEQRRDTPCIRFPVPSEAAAATRRAREPGAARRGAPARRQRHRADACGQHRAADGDDPGRGSVPAPAGGRARARARRRQRAARGRPGGRHSGALMPGLRRGRAAAGRAGVAPQRSGAPRAWVSARAGRLCATLRPMQRLPVAWGTPRG